MGRRNRRDPSPHRPLSAGSVRRREDQADGTWIVTTWSARPGSQGYTCPICGRRLASTTAHLVVWPEWEGVAERRHVHTACWRRRADQSDPVRW